MVETVKDSNKKAAPTTPLYLNDFEQIGSSMAKVVTEKNKRYGNSALDPLHVFNKAKASTSIYIRLDDKLGRIKNADEIRKNDVADIIGYLFLLCKNKGWTDFSDQID